METGISYNPTSLGTGMGAGYGYGVGAGGWIGGLLLGALLNNRNGLFGNNVDGDNCIGQRLTDMQIANTNTNINDVESNLTATTLAQTNSLGSLILNSESALNNTIRNTTDVLYAQTAGVKDAVQNVQFQNALQGKDMLAQTCEIKQAIAADGMATRALINENTLNETRDKLNEVQRERDLLATGNFPIGQPAHLHLFGDNMHMVPNAQTITQNDIDIAVQRGIGNSLGQLSNLSAANSK